MGGCVVTWPLEDGPQSAAEAAREFDVEPLMACPACGVAAMTLVDRHGRAFTRAELAERLRAYDACSPKLRRVLVAMLQLRERGEAPATPNEIAYECGYAPGMARSGNHGTGNTRRVMGPAVHVTAALTALRRRHGLVELTSRRDGWSGSAYMLTGLGVRVAATARAEGFDADAAAAEGKRARP